jgi:dipeptide transport system permease protein
VESLMTRYLLTRILSFIPAVIVVTLFIFAMGYYSPRNDARARVRAQTQDQAEYQSVVHALGLDQPFVLDYVQFLGQLARLDFGYPWLSRQHSINTIIKEKLPISLQIGFVAGAVLLVSGVTLGTLAAWKQNTLLDYAVVSVTVFLHSVPPYALAPLLLTLLVLRWHLFPVGYGWSGLANPSLIIPILILAVGPLALLVRQTRSGMLEVMEQEYVRTARAKGLSEGMVLLRHVLKNGLAPAMTTMGILFSSLLTGSVFVEEIFAIPGFGQLIATAVRHRDFAVLTATTTVAVLIVMAINLITDLAYGLLDPRVRVSR